MGVSNITYADGTLRGRETTDDDTGKKHGVSTYYHPDGTTVEATVTFDQGVESGGCSYYYEDGTLRATVTKSAGVVAALSLYKPGSDGGSLARRLSFDSNGAIDGTITHVNAEGVQVLSQTWSGGVRVR